MQVTSNSFSSNFLYQIQQLENQQVTLQNEGSSGLKVTTADQNPSVMNEVLNLQTEASANTQYQSNITQIQNSANTASDALNSLQSLVEQAQELATNAGGLNSTQYPTYAKQVGQLISQAITIGNTKDPQGNYLFGGTANGSPPFSATKDADGNITGVTYNGNSSVAESEIAPGLTVSAQTPGVNTSGTGPEGVFSDSRTGADLFNHLIALQQDFTSGNTSDISTNVAPSLGKDEDNVVTQISGNGVLQSSLEAAGNVASQNATSLDGQMSNDTNADLATTLTQLSQTQTAYQAALESGTMVMQTSLLNYLT